jgi:plastocyanin
MKRTAAGVLCFLVLVLLPWGVGGSASAAVKPKARKIKVDSRSYAYSPKKIAVTVGENVAIVLHSKDQRHDFTLPGGKVVVDVKGGKTATGTFKIAKPGTYKFYCSIPGHRAAGMEGTITAS